MLRIFIQRRIPVKSRMSTFDLEFYYIDNNSKLSELLPVLEEEPYVALDTEFVRNNTYFPKCCLVQFAGSKICGVIDPFCVDLAALVASLQKTTKVFHDAKQDIECLGQFGAIDIDSIFDTQIAEMFIDFCETRQSYKSLVHKYFGVQLDKALATADWCRRPIEDDLVSYALNDVTYLSQIYMMQHELLTQNNRMDICTRYMHEELHNSQSKENKEPTTLKEAILAWRTRLARENDIPQNKILHNNVITELVKRSPTTIREFYASRNYSLSKIPEASAKELIDIISAYQSSEQSHHKSHGAEVTELLKILLKIRCIEHQISPIVVATTKDIAGFSLNGVVPECSDLQYQIFWRDAEELAAGNIVFSVESNRIKITHRSNVN